MTRSDGNYMVVCIDRQTSEPKVIDRTDRFEQAETQVEVLLQVQPEAIFEIWFLFGTYVGKA